VKHFHRSSRARGVEHAADDEFADFRGQCNHHPTHAEAISHHAKPRRAEGLGERHLHTCPPLASNKRSASASSAADAVKPALGLPLRRRNDPSATTGARPCRSRRFTRSRPPWCGASSGGGGDRDAHPKSCAVDDGKSPQAPNRIGAVAPLPGVLERAARGGGMSKVAALAGRCPAL